MGFFVFVILGWWGLSLWVWVALLWNIFGARTLVGLGILFVEFSFWLKGL